MKASFSTLAVVAVSASLVAGQGFLDLDTMLWADDGAGSKLSSRHLQTCTISNPAYYGNTLFAAGFGSPSSCTTTTRGTTTTLGATTTLASSTTVNLTFTSTNSSVTTTTTTINTTTVTTSTSTTTKTTTITTVTKASTTTTITTVTTNTTVPTSTNTTGTMTTNTSMTTSTNATTTTNTSTTTTSTTSTTTSTTNSTSTLTTTSTTTTSTSTTTTSNTTTTTTTSTTTNSSTTMSTNTSAMSTTNTTVSTTTNTTTATTTNTTSQTTVTTTTKLTTTSTTRTTTTTTTKTSTNTSSTTNSTTVTTTNTTTSTTTRTTTTTTVSGCGNTFCATPGWRTNLILGAGQSSNESIDYWIKNAHPLVQECVDTNYPVVWKCPQNNNNNLTIPDFESAGRVTCRPCSFTMSTDSDPRSGQFAFTLRWGQLMNYNSQNMHTAEQHLQWTSGYTTYPGFYRVRLVDQFGRPASSTGTAGQEILGDVYRRSGSQSGCCTSDRYEFSIAGSSIAGYSGLPSSVYIQVLPCLSLPGQSPSVRCAPHGEMTSVLVDSASGQVTELVSSLTLDGTFSADFATDPKVKTALRQAIADNLPGIPQDWVFVTSVTVTSGGRRLSASLRRLATASADYKVIIPSTYTGTVPDSSTLQNSQTALKNSINQRMTEQGVTGVTVNGVTANAMTSTVIGAPAGVSSDARHNFSVSFWAYFSTLVAFVLCGRSLQ